MLSFRYNHPHNVTEYWTLKLSIIQMVYRSFQLFCLEQGNNIKDPTSDILDLACLTTFPDHT